MVNYSPSEIRKKSRWTVRYRGPYGPKHFIEYKSRPMSLTTVIPFIKNLARMESVKILKVERTI